MTTDLELDRVLASWLAEGPERAPADVVAAGVRAAGRTRQRRAILPWVGGPSADPRWWWVIAAVVVVGLIGVVTVIGAGSRLPVARQGDVSNGSSARILPKWQQGQGVAFTAALPAGAPPSLYWRAATYDRFALSGWEQTNVTHRTVPAGDRLLAGTAEDPSPTMTTQLRITIRPDTYRDPALLTPGLPVSVSRPSDVLLTDNAWFAGVDMGGDHSPYTVDAAVLDLGDAAVISGHRLEQAGTTYPTEMTARYTAVPDGTLGPDARALLETVRSRVASDNPYDLAVAMVNELADDRLYTYDPDLSDNPCTSQSAVECFARTKHGYCVQFASTMAMLLRAADPSNPIPTRLVQGFLPGTRDAATNVETVENRQAESWVEVYFPGYGWIPFDPTAHGVGLPSTIKLGPGVTPASAAPSVAP